MSDFTLTASSSNPTPKTELNVNATAPSIFSTLFVGVGATAFPYLLNVDFVSLGAIILLAPLYEQCSSCSSGL